MLELTFLIAILISPDGTQYRDTVAHFETPAQCEQAKRDWLKMTLSAKGFHYVAFCAASRPIGSTGV